MIAADLLIQQRQQIGRPCTLISKAVVGELLAIVFDVEPYLRKTTLVERVDGWSDGMVEVRERWWAVGPADDRSQIIPTGDLVSRRLVPIRETTRAEGLRRAFRPQRTTATEQEEA